MLKSSRSEATVLRAMAWTLPWALGVAAMLPSALPALADTNLFPESEMRDPATLEVSVAEPWHVDTVNGTTRQKLVEITVAADWPTPGESFRVPARLTVPLDQPAVGLWITSGHSPQQLEGDSGLSQTQNNLLAQGVGFLETVVAPLAAYQDAEMKDAMRDRFVEELDFRFTRPAIWSMTLMRALTWAHSESGDVDPAGKVFASGGSKNGLVASVALVNDDRFTGIYASVTPACKTDVRELEPDALAEVEAATAAFVASFEAGDFELGTDRQGLPWLIEKLESLSHPADETFLPYWDALDAGHTAEEYRAARAAVSSAFAPSEHLEALENRGVDMLFEPGTHDYVAFDLLECAQVAPSIPIYTRANDGHNTLPHPQAESASESPNFEPMILRHFVTNTPSLGNPSSTFEISGHTLTVTVDAGEIEDASGLPSVEGRVFWIYDRAPSGSAGFLWELIPDDHGADLAYEEGSDTWQAAIALDAEAEHVDFFANIGFAAGADTIYRSAPYSRVTLVPEGEALPMGLAAQAALALLLGIRGSRLASRGRRVS